MSARLVKLWEVSDSRREMNALIEGHPTIVEVERVPTNEVSFPAFVFTVGTLQWGEGAEIMVSASFEGPRFSILAHGYKVTHDQAVNALGQVMVWCAGHDL